MKNEMFVDLFSNGNESRDMSPQALIKYSVVFVGWS